MSASVWLCQTGAKVVSGSLDFRLAGHRGRFHLSAYCCIKPQQTSHPGREELLDSGSFHHADGDDHHRRICCGHHARWCIASSSALAGIPKTRERSRRDDGVVLHADLADLLGTEPDLQRTVYSRDAPTASKAWITARPAGRHTWDWGRCGRLGSPLRRR